jgi:hypothetical protein
MSSLKEVIDTLELNFYDNLLEIKRLLQLNMELTIWNKKIVAGIDPNIENISDNILREEIRKIEEENQINIGQINQLEFILSQEINALRNYYEC